MTTKNNKISQLKKIQKRKLEEIQTSTKRMWKRLFWLSIVLSAFVFYCIENSHVIFGSVTNFLILAFSVLLLVSVVYYLLVWYKKKRNLKEIKTINGKLYRLMKLEND